jgi:hypothetical protein
VNKITCKVLSYPGKRTVMKDSQSVSDDDDDDDDDELLHLYNMCIDTFGTIHPP